ncbi:MAG: MBL fold metallo-hydrolase [Oscillospiraceae bacterium]|nr:MBL fold metallo-hydrolase [Oscillospiraceae bacterium]
MDLNRFTSEKLTDHVYRIVDALDVACYLVVGEEKACLLDTCPGEGNIRKYVETITGLPLTVVLTHAHMDHCGGAGFFDRVYLKESEKPILATHKSQAFRADFFSEHHGLSLSPEDFAPVPEEVFEDFSDGMVLNLGGVSVELLPFPGHTPGTVCPFIPEDRTLIIGDACDDNVILFDRYSSTVSEYRENLKKMIERQGEYDRILGNHGCFEFTMELLENVLECCDRILAGTDAHLAVHMLGEDLLSANAIGENELRLDGKPGNILYSEEKAR